MSERYESKDVAVIGMAGRFPGAPDVETFWENLVRGVDSIRRFAVEELREARVPAALLEDPRYVRAKGVLTGIEEFDPALFGMTPREAAVTDPQHRLFLESVWSALERAGYDPLSLPGLVGVFAGASISSYAWNNLGRRPDVLAALGAVQLGIGVGAGHLATRVSYLLDLKGPSVALQTACSTSLVAVHLAALSLASYECDMALAGGASVMLPQLSGYIYEEGSILSPTGYCRAFDAAAQGTVMGEGVGVVVLKRAADALADGDDVLAVIRGSAINNDGAGKVGYTAPSPRGQAEVISAAHDIADLDAETFGYVEAHGTGTTLGDPIEVAALNRAFRRRTDRRGFCSIGSVKTNVGHLDAAAGVTGLIKTVLCLRHGKIPATLHFETPNPSLELDEGPFRVAAELTEWRSNGAPRRAGVSSFGLGGTNAHVILEEGPAPPVREEIAGPELVVLSARSSPALERTARAVADALGSRPEAGLADAAHTLRVGRSRFEHRLSFVAADRHQAIETLRGVGKVARAREAEAHRPVVFLFPGQGAQRSGMGAGLYAAQPAFRRAIDRCFDLLRPRLDVDPRRLLFPAPGDEAEAAALLAETRYTQPALFVLEHSLAELWEAYGVEPQTLAGHSIGEYVAACRAGVFTLEEGLELVCARGALMAELPPGRMLSVALGAEELADRLPESVELAAANSPTASVASGPPEAIEAFAAALEAAGVEHRLLPTSHAFHSWMMEPILEPFARVVARIDLRAPRLPVLSNLTGHPMTEEQAVDPAYWVEHLRRAVRFAENVDVLLSDPERLFVEVGPGRALTTLLGQGAGAGAARTLTSLSTSPGGAGEPEAFLEAVGRAWVMGAAVDLGAAAAERGLRRVALPGTPFERQRCWIDPPAEEGENGGFGAGVAAVQSAGSAVEVRRREPEGTPPADGLAGRAHLAVAYVAPEGEVETAIAAIWEELLGVVPVGADDSFLELGGHSLLAARVGARMRDALEVELPLSSLFESASLRQLAGEIDGLRAGERGAPRPIELPELVPAPRERYEPFPLTDVQQAYWVGRSAAFELGNVAAHAYLEIDVRDLDLGRLERAWNLLVRRHDMLRMVVLAEGRQQVLADTPDYRIGLLDLRRADPDAAARCLAELRRGMADGVVPTDRWPLFEIRASRTTAETTRLHVRVDYLLADAWSARLLARELLRLYDEPHLVLEPLALTFRDYVLAEQRLRETAVYAAALEYWRSRIPSLPEAPELPTAVHPSALSNPRFERLSGTLAAAAWRRLKAGFNRRGLTPSAGLATVFSEVLGTWSKRPRFTINLTLFNRLPLHPQVDELVGDFTSLTLLEVDTHSATCFEDRAKRLQARLWRDLDHRQVSAVQVLRDALRESGQALGGAPVVFTSTLSMAGSGELDRLAGDRFTEVYTLNQGPQVWLDHQVSEQEGDLVFNFDSVVGLFPDGMLGEMFASYRALLERLVEDADGDTGAWRAPRLPLLRQEHLMPRLLANRTEALFEPGLIHAGFFAQAARRPEAVAVIAPDRAVRYGELAVAADLLGERLRERGAARNRLVAVVMPKGWEQVAAVLGVLQAGAAYLPIDPALPAERRSFLLQHGEVSCALTLERLDAELEWPDGVERLTVDASLLDGSRPVPAIGRRQEAEHLAYVIFTSGSTGLPKGVMIDHQAALNTLEDVNERFAVGPEDRVLGLSSLSFDLSVYDIFGVLGAGGALVLPAAEEAREPGRWRQLVASHRITVWNTVPALMEMLVASAEGAGDHGLESLRLVLMSGDWIPLSLPGRIRALLPECRVISLGGATEGAIWSILYPIEEVSAEWKSIPYGRPMRNQTFHVLDERMEPRPDWVPGHLYIGGQGVALGYWRDEERTAASFVRHPVSGERFYRTGDLGRYRPDGVIEFLGREDTQVKIRGHRIELGEIEASLLRHPRVSDAVVIASGPLREGRLLVAYAIATEDAADEAAEALGEQRLEQWAALFDETYGTAPADADPTFDTAGWTSSFDGEPIPQEEMLEWVESTAQRISSLEPKRVLEIGCGTGMLLYRLAPGCESYVASDLSAAGLARIRSHLATAGDPLPQVELIHRAADDFSGVEPGSFDLVILNSVVQYFPHVEYLVKVLEGALEALAPGGTLFVGDVRDRGLHRAFHLAVEKARRGVEGSAADLLRRVGRATDEDEELSVSPDLFRLMVARRPRVSHAEILPKRGSAGNEMVRFRFDALLRTEGPAPEALEGWVDWRAAGGDLDALERRLEAAPGERLAVRGIPNARVAADHHALDRLELGGEGAAAALLESAPPVSARGVDPEALWALAERRGRRLTLELGNRPGTLWAVFDPQGEASKAPLAPPAPPPDQPWEALTNRPLGARSRDRLAEELRGFLAAKLPEYMVPGIFVFLERFPLSRNGKVDRSALPQPGLARVSADVPSEEPRTELEAEIAGIWRDLLNRPVGIRESFFDLGGHSVLAVQAMARIRRSSGVDLPLRALFENPTVRALAAEIETHRSTPAAAGETEAIPRASRRGPPPLSFAQQRLWFLDQLVPGNAFYNIPAGIRQQGEASPRALHQALNEVVRRHEALRTTFAADPDGKPFQVIHPALTLPLPAVDLSGLARADREGLAAALTSREAGRPFDLGRGPLIRATLLRLGGEESQLLLTVHHVISDGWSMGILYRELGVLYEAARSGVPPALPELPIQYADFAIWQQGRRGGKAIEEALGYWRRKLADLPTLGLPTDRPRPRFETFRGDTTSARLPGSLVEALRGLAQEGSATLFMAFLAVYQAVLARYTRQWDVVVGSSVAARTRPELERLIGFFLNMLVLRTEAGGELSFRQLLAKVREVTVEAYAHQDLPFEMLVEELDPERDTSRNPLCQTMLMYQNYPAEGAGSPLHDSLTVSRIDSGTAKFDLVLFLDDLAEGVAAKLEYNTDLFDATTIERFGRHLVRLLAGVTEEPDRPLGRIELLSPSEHHQIVREWNDESRPFATGDRLEALFERQVARGADRPAVIFEDRWLTYAEVERRANRLAHRLRALGIGPGAFVGVYLERSEAMIPALLAILKAGGAYAPFEVSWPTVRMDLVAQRLGIRVLLTEEGLLPGLEGLAPGGPVERIQLLRGGAAGSALPAERVSGPEEIASQPDGRPAVISGSRQIAYAIFTSGSTGEPKGVVVNHRAVVNLIEWVADRFALGETDRVLFVTSLGFDLSVYDVFGLLAAGGSIRVASSEQLRDPAALVRMLQRERITFWDSAPAALQQAAAYFPITGERRPLRLAFLSGDWIPLALPQQLRRAFPGVEVISLGGATEATVWSNVFPVREIDPHWVSIPYGRPIQNARYHCLEATTAPAPIGVPGDLLIGGECLSVGYESTRLTAAAFRPDPFASADRLYHTGDRVRFRPDGNLEFLGRSDGQVKLRGFRIELGEITGALTLHPEVLDAVAVIREDRPGDRRLVAYVVPKAGPAEAEEEAGEERLLPLLGRHLRDRLPSYMQPSAIVLIERIPVTANGKLDRKALPAPVAEAGGGAELAAPRTLVEERLASVWAEVLGLERVGRDQDFFDLGGHSLLATQVISRVNKAFDIDAPLRTLFEAPTVASFAECIAGLRGAAAGPVLGPARRSGHPPLSYAQQRLFFLHEMDPDDIAYNVPTAIRMEGRLDHRKLEESLREIVRRHEALRTTFHIEAGKPVQVIAPSAGFEIPTVDLSRLGDEAARGLAARLAAEEAQRPFDLARGPLLRVLLTRLGPAEQLALVTMHHIVSDGWSVGLLVQEVADVYAAFSAGRPSPLADLPLQYADYAIGQREWLESGAMEVLLDHWKDRLSGAPGVLELPFDRPRPPVQTHAGAMVSRRLPARLLRSLHAVSRQRGATLFMTILAAFQLLLGRYARRQDLMVGSPIAGRNQVELEGLIGFFVNTIVLRADLSGDPTFGELVDRVREVTLDAYAYQGLPFERLVDALEPERSLAHSPVVQVMLVLQNAARGSLELPGLTLTQLATDSTAAKLDLTLLVEELGDGLSAAIEYNTDLFDTVTIARFLDHLARVLEGCTEDAGRPIGDLSVHSPAERHQLLREWNDTAVRRRGPVCLHDQVLAAARRWPDRVVLIEDDRALSYAGLLERAERLAGLLAARGVGLETRVGVLAERSAAMIVALVAIHLARGAYVPLDPELPDERLALVLGDAGIDAVVRPAALGPRLAGLLAHAAMPVVDLEAAERSGAPSRSAAAQGTASPGNLAYVLYTSGSTGTPKGVMVSHAAIANRLRWMQERFPLEAHDKVVHKTTFAFDASIWEFYVPLVVGAAVVVARPGGQADPGYLLELVGRHQAVAIQLVPSLLPALLERPELAPAAGLRYLYFGGEALPAAAALEAGRRCGAEVFNLYGPTETAVDATFGRVPPDAAFPVAPIGRPLTNLSAVVVDPRLRPVPLGAPGELLVGGVNLARGYFGRPGLTARSFVPDAVSGRSGERLYRTGDLVRHGHDGRLEFQGRIDHQVKVRGFRIEPGEIEAVLRRYAGVAQATVLAVATPAGHASLVAYLAVGNGHQPDLDDLRGFLSQQLPPYMVPARFVCLPEIPRTTSGKLDRSALPSPDWDSAETATAAAETAEERILGEIWQQVLGLERVGRDDNFFALGGDSIQGILVAARAKHQGLQLRLKDLFEHQTLSAMARVAARSGLAIGQEPVVGPVGSTAIQRDFLESGMPDLHHYNQGIVLAPRERLDGGLLATALAALSRHHDALRSVARRRDGEWQLELLAVGAAQPELRTVDLSSRPAAQRSAAFDEEAERLAGGFVLESGPLFRACLFEMGAQSGQRLLLLAHHLVVDGVSWWVLVEDLERAYQAVAAGSSPELPPKTHSIAVWTEALAERAASEALAAELPYWTDPERASIPPLPRTPGTEGSLGVLAEAEVLTTAFSAIATEALLEHAPRPYRNRIEEVLLAALARALSDWAGGRRFLVDLETHGRQEELFDLDVSRTVGWFTATFPLLLKVRPSAGPGELLKSTKEARRSVPENGIGYGLLRHHAAHREALRGMPVAEVQLNYLGRIDSALAQSSLFEAAAASAGPPRSPRQPCRHGVEVAASIADGRLRVQWTFARPLAAAGPRLAESFERRLGELIEHCRRDDVGGYTPSDFPLVAFDQEAVDRAAPWHEGIDDLYPLSPLQAGFLFHALRDPGSGAYVQQLSCELRGPLDVERFAAQWQRVVDRHPILRTSFLWEGLPAPAQRVHRTVKVEIQRLDVSDLPTVEQEEWLGCFLRDDRLQGFELSRPPLLRLSLVRLGDGLHHFVWSHHHLILDGWSGPVVVREVMAGYAESSAGQAPVVPAEGYRRLIEWLDRQDRDAAADYWRARLAGFTVPTRVVADAGEAEVREIQEIFRPLDPAVAEAAKEYGRKSRLTFATLFFGAWALLLSHRTGRRDVVFGSTQSVRPPELDGIESMVGVFLNTLPFRVVLAPEQRVERWLRELQEASVEARRFDHPSLAEIGGWSDLPPGTPLFDSVLTVQNYPLDGLLDEADTGLEVGRVRYLEQATFPLSLALMPQVRLSLQVRRDPARISEAEAERIFERMERLFAAFAVGGETTVGDLVARLKAWDEEERGEEEREYHAARAKTFTAVRRRPAPSVAGAGTGADKDGAA